MYILRLHGKEQDFFTPYDLEISNEELNFVCRKSEQWRGEEGERKKTAVYDYIWEEEEVNCFNLFVSLISVQSSFKGKVMKTKVERITCDFIW